MSYDCQLFHLAKALKKSGYSHNFNYIPNSHPVINKNCKRNIWFNSAYSKNISTNIGRQFLNLVNHHFPFYLNLYKIFSRNSIKVSYSCMANMKDIKNSHNHHILQKNISISKKTCNCIDKAKCPLHWKCLTKNIIYQSIVTSNNPELKGKTYYGISKTRYTNHTKSFNMERYKNNTKLSKEV